MFRNECGFPARFFIILAFETIIRLVEESCEHFAIIDDEVVWYGSMDLLAKEDAEDNLMRVCSRKIAAELLELTFGGHDNLQAW